MKKGLLFTVLTCAFAMGLASCQQGGGGTPTPPEPVTYDVSITNKTALQAEWRVGDDARPVNVKIPGVVTAEALANGDLVIASNHTDILSIAGNQASPVSEGTARITATYKTEFSDYVDVTIQKAPVYKMASTLSTDKEYILAHKNADGSGRLVSASLELNANFYIAYANSLDEAPVATVVQDSNTTSDYKYSINLTVTSAEGEETTKTVGVAVTAKGKFAAGFDQQEVTPSTGGAAFTPTKAMFKLDEEYRLVTKVVDTFDNDKEYELVLGASGTYNTFGFGEASKIVNPAHLYELSTVEIPATSLTVEPTTVNLHPNGVQALTVTYEPFNTTDNLSFKSSNENVATVSLSGKISALSEGTATVTVTLGSKTQTVAVTVEGDPIEFGTKDNPIDVDTAIKSLDAIGQGNMSPKPLYVKGTVVEIASAWDAGYKNGSYWLGDKDGKKAFELYRAVVVEGIEGKDIGPGDEVKCYGFGTLYNTTYELTTVADGNPASPTIYEWVDHEPPVDPDPTEVTVAGAIAVMEESGADTTTKDKYAVTGYVTQIKSQYSSQYGNISVLIADEVGGTPTIQAYRAKCDAETGAKITVGCQVKAIGNLSNSTQYGMQVAEGGKIEFLKAAEAQPQTIEATVAEAQAVLEKMEAGAKTFDNYAVTGYIIKVNTEYSSQYGNLSVTIADTADAETGLYAYRAKCDAEAGAKAIVGAQVKITGPLDKNSHGDQIAEGSALVVLKDSPVVPPEPQTIEATVAEAMAVLEKMETGAKTTDKYAVTGYIIKVNTPYSDQFGNVSVTIADAADAEEGLLAYRAKCDAAAGDKAVVGAQVKVTGLLDKNSHGDQIAEGSALEILKDSPDTPAGPTVATVAQALAAVKALDEKAYSADKYEVTGYITEVTSIHSLYNNNATVKIGDTADATETLTVYNAQSSAEVAEKWLVGAKIKVTGILYHADYNPVYRFDTGAKVEFLEEVRPEYKTVDVGNSYKLDGMHQETPTAYAGENKVVQGEEGKEVTWYVNGNVNQTPWRIGGKSLDKVDRRIYSADKMSTNFDKIEIEVGTASSITVNSVKLQVYSAFGKVLTEETGDVSSLTAGAFAANSTITFARPEGADWSNCYYSIVFNVTVSVTSNKFVQVKGITFSVVE